MQITVVKSGGFAGIHEQLGPFDTSSLDGDLGQRIEAEVEAIGFFDLDKEVPDEEGAGQTEPFGYGLTVEDGQRSNTVEFGDNSDPGRAAPLKSLLRQIEESGLEYRSIPFNAE